MADDDYDENDDREREESSDHEEDTEDVERRLAEAVASDDEDDDSDEELGERGERALSRMKEERKRLRAEMREMAETIKKYEDANKSESQRLQDDATSYKSKAEAAEQKLMRLEVAMSKGLTAKQAARLSGDTVEELEEDADELLALFKRSDAKPASSKPKEQLRGGGDPEDEPEENNPSKLAAAIPRNRFS